MTTATKFHILLGRVLTVRVNLEPEREADAMRAAAARVFERCASLVELHVERVQPWALVLVPDRGDLAADLERVIRELVLAWEGIDP